MYEEKLYDCRNRDVHWLIAQLSSQGKRVRDYREIGDGYYIITTYTHIWEEDYFIPVRKEEKSDFIPIKGNVKKVSI